MFTILLVEDDPSVRGSLARLLEDIGHQVVEASNAEVAMKHLQASTVDVLITGIALSGDSGEVFAAEARSIRPRLRIIFATDDPSIPDVSRQGPGPILLHKPFDRASVSGVLHAAAALFK